MMTIGLKYKDKFIALDRFILNIQALYHTLYLFVNEFSVRMPCTVTPGMMKIFHKQTNVCAISVPPLHHFHVEDYIPLPNVEMFVGCTCTLTWRNRPVSTAILHSYKYILYVCCGSLTSDRPALQSSFPTDSRQRSTNLFAQGKALGIYCVLTHLL